MTFSEAPAGVTASLVTGSATGEGTDTLAGIEHLFGSPFDDAFTGDAGPNILMGEGGTDTLIGNEGDDQLHGGLGDDDATLDGGPGNDYLTGGPGADRFLTSPGDDLYDGGDGTDTLSFAAAPGPILASLLAGTAAGDGDDALVGIENLIGSEFADFLEGSNATNELFGLGDDDHIFGLDSPELLDGGDGSDVLDGGAPTPPAAGVDTCLNGEVLLDCEA